MKLRSLVFIGMIAPSISFGATGIFDELIWTTTTAPFSFGSATFYEIDSDTSNLFGAAEFHGASFGTFNLAEALYLTGEQKSFKNGGTNVTGHALFWSISGTGGSGSGSLGYGFETNLGGSPGNEDQRWGAANGGSMTSNVLNGLGAGSYTLSVWTRITTNGTNAPTEVFNNRGGSNFNATLNIIPEPSSAALGLIGSLLLLRRRRM